MWKDVMPSPSFPPTVQWTVIWEPGRHGVAGIGGASGAELGVTEFVGPDGVPVPSEFSAAMVKEYVVPEVSPLTSKESDVPGVGSVAESDAPAEIVTADPAVDADEGVITKWEIGSPPLAPTVQLTRTTGCRPPQPLPTADPERPLA